MLPRIRLSLLITLVVAVAITLLIAILPALSFGHRIPDAHVAIETALTLVAMLVSFLLYGRLRDTGRRSDLLLFTALTLLALSNLGMALGPAFDGRNNEVIWAPVSARLIAAAILTAGAFAPDAPLRRPDRALAYVCIGVAGAAGIAAVIAASSSGLSTGIDPSLSPTAAGQPLFEGSALFVGAQLACMLLLVTAAFGLVRRAERHHDQLLSWLAIGTGLAAVARLNSILFPSVYSDWVFSGDLVRFAAYLAILVGALGEIARSQRTAARAAMLEERQRIARDLHDRLAQDLAFISREGMRLAEHHEEVADLAGAAQSALGVSREAIHDLSSSDAPLCVALADLATGLAGRHGTRLRLELDETVDTSVRAREDLLCIASESISNAVRHSDASEISIRLRARNGKGLALTIADDGRGFEPQAPGFTRNGFGLVTMRTRVERLGGRFRLRSRPGAGTTVEVVLP